MIKRVFAAFFIFSLSCILSFAPLSYAIAATPDETETVSDNQAQSSSGGAAVIGASDGQMASLVKEDNNNPPADTTPSISEVWICYNILDK